MEFIHNLGKTGEIINAVLLTHSHPDHMGSAKSIKEECGCPVYASKCEETGKPELKENPLFMRSVMSDFKRWKAMAGTCDTAYEKVLAKNEKTC